MVAPANTQERLFTEQLSAIVGFVVATLAVQVPGPTTPVAFAGHVIVGFILSLIVTVKEHVAVLLEASLTV